MYMCGAQDAGLRTWEGAVQAQAEQVAIWHHDEAPWWGRLAHKPHKAPGEESLAKSYLAQWNLACQARAAPPQLLFKRGNKNPSDFPGWATNTGCDHCAPGSLAEIEEALILISLWCSCQSFRKKWGCGVKHEERMFRGRLGSSTPPPPTHRVAGKNMDLARKSGQ